MDRSARQIEIIAKARRFAELEIRPRAAEIDRAGTLPPELVQKMAERKFLAASWPEEYGGLALDPVHYGLFTEEIGKACCAMRALISVQTSLVGETLLRCATEGQKRKWLPLLASGSKIGAFALSEPGIGSDAKSIETHYKRSGEGYLINGRKKWITFGQIADLLIVIASRQNRVTAFLVERPSEGISSSPISGLLAGRATQIAEIQFQNVAVPGENILGAEGNGFSFVVNTALDRGRYSIAWAGVAIAQEALESMVSYSRKRTQFGQRIYKFQLVLGMIGDAVTKTHAARALCLRAGELREAADPAAIQETAMAKYFASQVALEVASNSVQVHGGSGCCDAYPAERLFREARILGIVEGTSQIHQELIGLYGLKRYFRKDYAEIPSQRGAGDESKKQE